MIVFLVDDPGQRGRFETSDVHGKSFSRLFIKNSKEDFVHC